MDNNIIVWDTTGKILAKHIYFLEYELQSGFIEFAGFSPECNYVFFVMNNFLHPNHIIKIWDWKNNKIIAKIDYFSANINTVSFINNEEILVSSADNNIYITNYKTDKTKELIGHSNNVFDAKFNKNNQTVSSISADKTIKSWKIFTQETVFDKYIFPEIIAFSNKSTNFAVYADNKFEILSSIGTVIFSTVPKTPILTIYFTENDEYIVTTSTSKINILNKKGKKISSIDVDSDIIFTKINEKNKRIAISTNNKISIFNLSGVSKNSLTIDSIIAVDIDFERKQIIYSNSKIVKIIDLKNKVKESINIKDIYKVKFNNKNKSSFLTSKDTIFVIDKKFRILHKIHTPNSINSEISKSGNLIVWYDNSGNCRLLNSKGEELYNFKHKNYILNAQFSADEKTLLTKTISNQGEIKIYSWFISIDEIINYVNTVKIFGDVYKPPR